MRDLGKSSAESAKSTALSICSQTIGACSVMMSSKVFAIAMIAILAQLEYFQLLPPKHHTQEDPYSCDGLE
jgi:hypothetical protein